jgi:hypothetical protein
MRHETRNRTLLSNSLIANAIFSFATGALLTIASPTVGRWLGVDINGWLRMLGIALLGHAAILVIAARRNDPRPLAKLNLMAIAPYPVLMILLAATGLIERPLGQGLLLVDGAIVAVLAVLQATALRSAEQHPQTQPA